MLRLRFYWTWLKVSSVFCRLKQVSKKQLFNSPHSLNSRVWVLILQPRVWFPIKVKSPVEHSPNWPLGGIVLEGLPVYHIDDGGNNSGPAWKHHIHLNSPFYIQMWAFYSDVINKKCVPVIPSFGRTKMVKILLQPSLATFSLVIQNLCGVWLDKRFLIRVCVCLWLQMCHWGHAFTHSVLCPCLTYVIRNISAKRPSGMWCSEEKNEEIKGGGKRAGEGSNMWLRESSA